MSARMMGALGGRLGAFRDARAGEGDFAGAVSAATSSTTRRRPRQALRVVAARLERFAERARCAAAGGSARRRVADAVTAPEFSRPVRIDTLGAEPRALAIEAERRRARRAGEALRPGRDRPADRRCSALTRDGRRDRRRADACAPRSTQSCVASGEPVAGVGRRAVRPPVPAAARPERGRTRRSSSARASSTSSSTTAAAIDLGEAVAETLSLSLDPYPRAPGAEEALKAAGVKSEEEAGPFGALAGLKDKLSNARPARS